jgi:hypothetical protein
MPTKQKSIMVIAAIVVLAMLLVPSMVDSAVSWSGLTGFPSACPTPNQFVNQISSTPTCALVNQGYNSTGLVGYWPLTEGSGNYAYDLSGNGNTGTLVNSPAWLSGSSCKFSGSCLNFSQPSTQKVTTTLLQSPSFSVSAWIEPSSFSTNQIIFASNWALVLPKALGRTSDVTFLSCGHGLVTGGAIGLNDWTFVTLSVDNANPNNVKIYENSTLSVSSPLSSQLTGSSDFGISVTNPAGCSSETTFNGKISDVNVFNYVVSSSQVLTLYNTVPFNTETQVFSLIPNSWHLFAQTISLASGTSSATVTMTYSEPDTSYQVICTPNYSATVYVTSKTDTTFTITYTTTTAAQLVDCEIIHS